MSTPTQCVIKRVIDSYISTSLIFIYKHFNTGKQRMNGIYDPTL